MYDLVVAVRSCEYTLSKRFSDFSKFHQLLQSKYGVNFPGFPSKVTVLKSHEAIIKERRTGLLKFLDFVLEAATDKRRTTPIEEFLDFLQITAYSGESSCLNNRGKITYDLNYRFNLSLCAIECIDIMGIMIHLNEQDKHSLYYFNSLEKLLFGKCKALRSSDVSRIPS